MTETTTKTNVAQNVLTDLTSFNAFGVVTLSDGQNVNVQLTMRHGMTADKMMADFAEYVKFLDTAARDHSVKFWDGNKSAPKQEASASPSAPKPAREGEHAGTYDDPCEFAPTKLEVIYDNGKQYFKVRGEDGKFPKFPVAIWIEVIEKAGIKESDIDPRNGYSLVGWTAKYIKNEKGNPGKVIELVKPPF